MTGINEKLMEILKKKNLLSEEEIKSVEEDIEEKKVEHEKTMEEQTRIAVAMNLKPRKKIIAPLQRSYVDNVCLGRADDDGHIAHEDDCIFLSKADDGSFVCLKATEKQDKLDLLRKLARDGKSIARRSGDCNTTAFRVKEVTV